MKLRLTEKLDRTQGEERWEGMQPYTGRNMGPRRNKDEEEVHAPGGRKRTQETTKNVAVSKGPASLLPC